MSDEVRNPQVEGESTAPEQAALEQAVEAPTEVGRTALLEREQAAPEPEPRTKRGVALAVVVAAAAIAAIAFFLWSRVLPPPLTPERALEDFGATFLTAQKLTSSDYATNAGYEIVSQRVVSLEENGVDGRVTYVEVELENESFHVVVEGRQNFDLQDRIWKASPAELTSVSATPVAPPDVEMVRTRAGELVGKVAPKGGVSLASLYEGGDVDVRAGELVVAEDGSATCDVTVTLQRSSDLIAHHGEVVATFEFVPGKVSMEAGSWQVGKLEAADSSWEGVTAPLAGAWTSELSSTVTSAVVFKTGRCHAGEAEPFALDVESFDVETGKMVCSMRFVSHNHGALDADAEGAEGDAVVEAEHVTVMLDPKTLGGTWEPSDQAGEQGEYEVRFANVAGSWHVTVSSQMPQDDALGSLFGVSFADVYVLSRA